MEDKKMAKSRLGAGLDAIFGNLEKIAKNKIEEIELSQIEAAEWQPRKLFDQEEVGQLASSIKRYGVLQPILLKKNSEGRYKIIAGERRFRASTLANLVTIPSIVVDFTEQQALEVSMIENLQRKDLNPVEKAEGFAFLIEKLNVSQEELAHRLGINRSVISNYLRINTLPDDIKHKLINGKITAGHAKILVNKTNASELAEEIVTNKLSVRDIEAKYKKPSQSKPKIVAEFSKDEEDFPKKNDTKISEISAFESMISETLSTQVKIEMDSSSKGRIILEFSNFSSLEKIIEKICL